MNRREFLKASGAAVAASSALATATVLTGSEARAEEAIVAAGEEQGVAQTLVGDLVAVSARDTPNESTQPQAPKVIGDRAGGGVTAA